MRRLLLLLCAVGCTSKRDPPPPTAPEAALPASPQPLSVPPPDGRPWAAINETDARCADCHPQIVARWKRSPMGRSVGPITRRPAGAAIHPTSKVRYTAEPIALGLRQTAQAGEFSQTQTMSQAIGSGRHTQSYLWQTAGRIFQAPLTWYSRVARWDLSPGYAESADPGLGRRIREECVGCHASFPAETRQDVYRGPLQPIGCARCHGDGLAHADGRERGEAVPALRPDDVVCNACHLQGTVRILNPGKRWRDHRPGMAIGDVWTVFVRAGAASDFGIASQAERLALSACAQKSALKCTTCHDPHGATEDRSKACRDCHATQRHCSGGGGSDCVKCHMGRGATHDVPHVSAVDHFIRKAPEPRPPGATIARPSTSAPLVPADATPNPPPGVVGRAYAEAFRQRGDPLDAKRGLQALRDAPLNEAQAQFDLAQLARVAGDEATADAALDRAFTLAPADWRIAVSMVRHRLRTVRERADGTLRAALTAHPDEAELWYARAQVLMGQRPGAEAALDRALSLDPDHVGALTLRALLHEVSGDVPAAARELDRALAFRPTDRLARIARAELAIRRGKHAVADTHFSALGADPEGLMGRARAALGPQDIKAARRHFQAAVAAGAPPHVASVHGRLALADGELDTARGLLEQATEEDPSDPDVWAALAQALERSGDKAGAAAARDMAKSRKR